MKNPLIKAIPTVYNSVAFRSRLESRWAAYFDLKGKKWQYEPFDLRGFIPDFLVDDRYLVECKPTIGPDWYLEAYQQFCKTMDQHAYYPVIVGSGGLRDVYQISRKTLREVPQTKVIGKDDERLWRIAGNMVQWNPFRREPA